MATWELALTVNITGMFLCCQAVGRQKGQRSLCRVGHQDVTSHADRDPSAVGREPWVLEPRDSGKAHHSRLSRIGTARVRAGLYLPAVSALRWNPLVKALGDRLKARGKTGRVRVVAAMHKLMRLCFGVLKSGRPFDLAALHSTTV